MTDRTDALYHKYDVRRTDGKGVAPCIVLEYDDPTAWPALETWAATMEAEGLHQLAKSVRGRLQSHRRIAELFPEPTDAPPSREERA